MAAELHPEIEIVAAPTVREVSGLAMSSRNIRLSNNGRVAAESIARVLNKAAAQESLDLMKRELSKIEAEPSFKLDYVEVIDEETFELATEETAKPRAIIAGWIDGVRLIDNMAMQRTLVRL